MTRAQLNNIRVARQAARRHGINARLFLRQMAAEANFTDATSPAGAQGPAQIMPATARGWGVKNVHDPREAYNAAAKAMKGYLRAFGGSWEKALRAYNAGPAGVKASYGYEETNNYVRKILNGKDVTDSVAKAAAGGLSLTGRPGRRVKGRTPQFIPGGTTVDKRQALLDTLVEGGSGSLLKRWMAKIDTGAYTTTTKPRVVKARGPKYLGGNVGVAGGGGAAKAAGGVDIDKIEELFWNGPRAVNIDDGKRVRKGYVTGHKDHVHAAFETPALARRAARLAKEMGLTVLEYAPMDRVDPVHTSGSFHYQKGGRIAMDVSGKGMAAFARRIARGDF